MIEVKAKADDSRGGCDVSISFNGNGKDLVEETLALIQGVMGSLKDEDIMLHFLVLKTIADHKEILLGNEERDEHDDKADAFERFVATAKFREGVN